MSDGFATEVAALRMFLRRLALSWVHDPTAAEDLVHDTLVRALTCRQQFQAGTNLRGWTRSIMRNIFLDACRRRPRFDEVSLEQIPAPPIPDDIGMLDLFRSEHVHAAASRLSTFDREIFRLAHVEGASYREIAAQFGLKQATIGSRLHRLRQKLRSVLESSLAGADLRRDAQGRDGHQAGLLGGCD
jgi:RNA polymerase sigma-70 factor (ECF subfamily)